LKHVQTHAEQKVVIFARLRRPEGSYITRCNSRNPIHHKKVIEDDNKTLYQRIYILIHTRLQKTTKITNGLKREFKLRGTVTAGVGRGASSRTCGRMCAFTARAELDSVEDVKGPRYRVGVHTPTKRVLVLQNFCGAVSPVRVVFGTQTHTDGRAETQSTHNVIFLYDLSNRGGGEKLSYSL